MGCGNSSSKKLQKYKLKQKMMADFNGLSQQQKQIESIKDYCKEELKECQNFKSIEPELNILAEQIQENKLKGVNFGDQMDLVEELLEKMDDLPAMKRREIKQSIKNAQLRSLDFNTFDSVIKILQEKQKQPAFESQFLIKYSTVQVRNPFDDFINKNEQKDQSKDLFSEIKQFKWKNVYEGLNDKETSILDEIKFILPSYPYIKQWIYLRKSFDQLMTLMQNHMKKDFLIINSLTFQDILILLYLIIPQLELKQIGECLVNNYTPLPLIIKSGLQNDSFLLLDDFLFYHIVETQKNFLTYVNTSAVKQEESCAFISRILCQDPQNNFKSSSQSMKFDKSVQLIGKISHKEGNDKIFIRINDFNSNQSEIVQKYHQILGSLFQHSQTIIVHTLYSQLLMIGRNIKSQSQNELDCLIKLISETQFVRKIIFVCDKIPEDVELAQISNEVKYILNNCTISFVGKNQPLLDIWFQINQQANQDSIKFTQDIFKNLRLLINPFSQLNQFESISNSSEIARIIKDIEKSEKVLLQLNNMEKQIVDVQIESVKMRININQQINQEEMEKLDLKKSEYKNALEELKIRNEVIQMLESVLKREKNQNIIDQNKVFQLKMIISKIRGKYQDEYQQKYLDISKLIQEKVSKVQQNTDKNAQKNYQLNKEALKLQEQLKKLDSDHQKNEITFDMIVNEFSIAQEKTNDKPTQYKYILEQFFTQKYYTGKPMQLIEGNTLQFGNVFLKEIAKEILDKNLFVISIVGLQSSAKSTLLNYLFQVDFAVGNGRVTKGLYFTRIILEDQPVIIIDTEGLMSLVGRDHQYDNSIMAFVFLISNFVIFNQKGEANQLVKELLELCGKVVQQLLQNRKPPTVIFALRDQNEVNSVDNIQKQVIQIATSICSKNGEGSSSMEIKVDNVILFPPAFNEQQIEGISSKQSNQIFSVQVLKLRSLIYSMMKQQKESTFQTFKDFYHVGFDMWKLINGNCSDLIIARNIKEYEDKLALQLLCQEVIREEIFQIKVEFSNLKKVQIVFISDSYEEMELIKRRLEEELSVLFTQKQNQLQEKILEKCNTLKICDENIMEIQKKITMIELDRQKSTERQNLLIELQHSYTEFVAKQKLNTIEEYALNILKNNKNKDQLLNEVKSHMQHIVDTFKQRIEQENLQNKGQVQIQIKNKWKTIFLELKQQRGLKKSKPILYKFYDSFFSCAQEGGNYHYDISEKFQVNTIWKRYILLKDIEDLLQIQSNKILDYFLLDLINATSEQNEMLEKNTLNDLINKLHNSINDIQNKEYIAFTENYENSMAILLIKIVYKLQKVVIQNISQRVQSANQQQIQNHQEKVDQTIKTIEGILKNAGDSSQQGKTFMADNLISEIIEHFIKNATKDLDITVEKIIKDNIESPSKENKMAFSLCWDEKNLNLENLIKFYLNTPKFIKEMILQRLQTQKIKEEQRQLTICNEKLQDLIIKLDIKLQDMVKNFEYNQKQSFGDYIKSNMSEFTQSFPNLKLYMQKEFNSMEKKAFLNGMYDGFKGQKELNAKEKFKQKIEQQFQKSFQEKVNNAIGCCEVCPQCGAKCILGLNHEGTHDVDKKHRFTAFNGLYYRTSQVFCRVSCYSLVNVEWYSGEIKYPDYISLCKKQYPTWEEHFKNLNNEKLSFNFDENFQKMVYYLTGKWFGNYYNKNKEQKNLGIVEIPKKFLEVFQNYKNIPKNEVDPNKTIDGYS